MSDDVYSLEFDSACLRILLEAGPDLTITDALGNTPLHIATLCRHTTHSLTHSLAHWPTDSLSVWVRVDRSAQTCCVYDRRSREGKDARERRR